MKNKKKQVLTGEDFGGTVNRTPVSKELLSLINNKDTPSVSKILKQANAFAKAYSNITYVNVEQKEDSDYYFVVFRTSKNRQASISVSGIEDDEWKILGKLLASL